MAALHYSVAVVGGLLGGLTGSSHRELRRAPYVVFSGIVVLASGLVRYSAVPFIVPALNNGGTWMIAGSFLMVPLCGGFFVARIAKARSRNAYGHARMAILAFIPLVNIWLFFAPPKNLEHGLLPRAITRETGVVVLFGLALIAAGMVLREQAVSRSQEAWEEAYASGKLTDWNQDPEDVAKQLASVAVPQVIDEQLTLIRVEAEGSTVSYVYEIAGAANLVNQSELNRAAQAECNYYPTTQLVIRGLRFEYIYLTPDGEELGRALVAKDACGL